MKVDRTSDYVLLKRNFLLQISQNNCKELLEDQNSEKEKDKNKNLAKSLNNIEYDPFNKLPLATPRTLVRDFLRVTDSTDREIISSPHITVSPTSSPQPSPKQFIIASPASNCSSPIISYVSSPAIPPKIMKSFVSPIPDRNKDIQLSPKISKMFHAVMILGGVEILCGPESTAQFRIFPIYKDVFHKVTVFYDKKEFGKITDVQIEPNDTVCSDIIDFTKKTNDTVFLLTELKHRF